MDAKEREVLLKEIKKSIGEYSLVIDDDNKERLSLLKMLNDEKLSKKILIKNEYGILANLLYKYRNELDDEILINLFLADYNLVNGSYYYDGASRFEKLPNELQRLVINDRNFLLTFLSYYPYSSILSHLDYNWWDDRDIVLAVAGDPELSLALLNEKFRDDEEIVLKIVRHSGWFLKNVSDRLKDNEKVVFEAAANDRDNLKYASSRLKNDKEFMQYMLYNDSMILKYVSGEYDNYDDYYKFADILYRNQADECIKGEQTKNWWTNILINDFLIASETLRDDKDFVFNIIKRDSFLFEYVSDRLKDDKELVMMTLRKDKNVWNFISDRLKKDKDIILLLIRKWKVGLGDLYTKYGFNSMLDAWVYEDKKIVLASIKNNRKNICHINDKLLDDKRFMLKLINKYGISLKYASSRLINDKSFIMKVIKGKGYYLEIINDKFRDDRDIVELAIEDDGYYLKYASSRLKNDKELVIKAITNNTDAINFIGDDLLFDEDVLEIIKNYKDNNSFKPIKEICDKWLNDLIMNN